MHLQEPSLRTRIGLARNLSLQDSWFLPEFLSLGTLPGPVGNSPAPRWHPGLLCQWPVASGPLSGSSGSPTEHPWSAPTLRHLGGSRSRRGGQWPGPMEAEYGPGPGLKSAFNTRS